MKEKNAASRSFYQFFVICFFRRMPRFELIATKPAPRMPQMTPTMIAPGITSTVGGVILLTPNLSTDELT